VKHAKVFSDSQLDVQQILGEYQCLDGTLNDYLKRCWDIIHSFYEFDIQYISRIENSRANDLAHEASGYQITQVFGSCEYVKVKVTGFGSCEYSNQTVRSVHAGPSGRSH
jgi:hypothetical protein